MINGEIKLAQHCAIVKPAVRFLAADDALSVRKESS